MERSEEVDAIANPAPVFVDDTGRRRALTRRAGRIVLVGVVGYLGLLGAGFARDPRLGPLGLPTFGLPALHPEPAPVAVLGQTTDRTAAETAGAGKDETAAPTATADRAGMPPGPGVPADPTAGPTGRPGLPAATPASGPASAPTTSTTTTTTGPTHPGNGPRATTTTAPSSSTTSTTTSTVPGQGSGSAAAKGPDGAGPPGQDRKATTTTTAPKR